MTPFSESGNSPPTKLCTTCHQLFPATTEFFYKRKERAAGLYSRCNKCACAASLKWKRAKRVLFLKQNEGRICGKPMRPAKNGTSRGQCEKPIGHYGMHSSGTCSICGHKLTKENASPSLVSRGNGHCLACYNTNRQIVLGRKPMNYQTPGAQHTFSCGCSGILPQKKGDSNKFARWSGRIFSCRILNILSASQGEARERAYKPIPKDTPHAVIRKMMEDPTCERCQQPLSWDDLGYGKTPHLHHDHATGEMLGFTHNRCNFRAMEIEIERLKELLQITNSLAA